MQSDIIDSIDSRLVIPLMSVHAYDGRIVKRLNPILQIKDDYYLVMAHELAGVPLSVVDEEVCRLDKQRGAIKSALDFVFDGFLGRA